MTTREITAGEQHLIALMCTAFGAYRRNASTRDTLAAIKAAEDYATELRGGADGPVPVADNPALDATELAHPAWVRGYEYGLQRTASALQAAFDGTDRGDGALPHAGLQAMREALLATHKQKVVTP